MSLVGGNNFATGYKGAGGSGARVFQTEVWAPAFLQVWKKNKGYGKEIRI